MKDRPHYINMGINFSILALLIYLAVQIGDIKDRMSGEHQLITNNQSKIVTDKGEELALAIMNKLLVELTEKTE